MTDQSQNPDWWQILLPRSPFTIPWLRETIEALGDRYSVPSESALETLTVHLNMGAGIYANRELVRAARARSAKWFRALQVLQSWHDDRYKELEAANIPPEFVESETQLYAKFNAYMEALKSHEPSLYLVGLPMDVDMVISPLKNWRDIAEYIADAFVQAMEESNPGRTFGFSDNGPAVKFTLAALELIDAAPQADPETARARIAQCIRELKGKRKRKEKPDL